MSEALADVRAQVMWNRLIAVVEEQAVALVRTAFSTSVRESGDLSAGVFDRQGRMIAQAVTGTPGHVNAMAAAVGHFIKAIGEDNIFEGDAYITNDPWLGTGHLHDLTMVSPSFRKGKLIGYFACTAHVVDVGGRGFGPDANEVYEEGICIPIMKFAERGKVNRDLVNILHNNVREFEAGGRRRLFARLMQRDRSPPIDRHARRVRHRRDRYAGRVRVRPQPRGDHREDPRPTERYLPQRHAGRRLRLARRHGGRHDGQGRGDPRRFRRHLEPESARHQRAADLYDSLCGLWVEGRVGAGNSEQLGIARAVQGFGAARLHLERSAPRRRRGAPCARPLRPGYDPRRDPHHAARPCAGGGLGRALEHPYLRASERRQPAAGHGGSARRGVDVQLRRLGRASQPGRHGRDRLPLRRAHHVDRGHRACRTR